MNPRNSVLAVIHTEEVERVQEAVTALSPKQHEVIELAMAGKRLHGDARTPDAAMRDLRSACTLGRPDPFSTRGCTVTDQELIDRIESLSVAQVAELGDTMLELSIVMAGGESPNPLEAKLLLENDVGNPGVGVNSMRLFLLASCVLLLVGSSASAQVRDQGIS